MRRTEGCVRSGLPVLALVAASCVAYPSPAAVSWRPEDPVFGSAPRATSEVPEQGYLVVETDTDATLVAGNTTYYLRRGFDLYSSKGKLLRRVDNQGARGGEEPILLPVPAGRYVVGSRVSTTYRRVQVEVHPGALTRVTERDLHGAAPVPFQ